MYVFCTSLFLLPFIILLSLFLSPVLCMLADMMLTYMRWKNEILYFAAKPCDDSDLSLFGLDSENVTVYIYCFPCSFPAFPSVTPGFLQSRRAA